MRIGVSPSRAKNRRVMLNLTSMIDIIFLLLIYFMVTLVVNMPEDRLSSTIQTQRDPAAGSYSDFQPQIVEVTVVDGEPGYRFGTQVYRDAESLRTALEPLDKQSGLFIKVGNEPPVGFTVAAFQAGHDAGFSKVTYVAPNS